MQNNEEDNACYVQGQAVRLRGLVGRPMSNHCFMEGDDDYVILLPSTVRNLMVVLPKWTFVSSRDGPFSVFCLPL